MCARPAILRMILLLAAAIAAAAPSWAALTPDRVLLLYNSENAESLAVRNLYLAAHPDIAFELDLADSTVGPGGITRSSYLSKIRAPLLEFLADDDEFGTPLAQRVICIVTTRGLPARVNGGSEFTPASSWASLESELSLCQKDLEGAGNAVLPFHYSGVIDNPYHARIGQPIDSFTRANITTPRLFQYFSPGAWRMDLLGPGEIYLVVRLDAAPTETASAVENIGALLARSSRPMVIDPCSVQVLLDEYACGDQLDDDGFTSLFPAVDDFDLAESALTGAGVSVLHDETADFIEPGELPDGRPLLAFGTYGENHDVSGCGDNPPGQGVYPFTYTYHPAAAFISFESFNGNSIVDGTPRQGQAQALDFIASGGSFTIGTIREPFTFGVPDIAYLSRNLFLEDLTFAEAAYSAIPAISWQCTPVGDPLALVRLDGAASTDIDGSGEIDIDDLYAFEQSGGVDTNCDTVVDNADRAALRDLARDGEPDDVAFPR